MTSIQQGFEALTTIHDYELSQMKKKAKEKATEVSLLMNEGKSITAAFNISHVYHNEDLMFTAYFMEELKIQLQIS